MSGNHPRRWTVVEDEVLRRQVDAQEAQGGSRDWCQIALALPGRSNKDCRKRWHNSVAAGLKKGQWSKSEDELLTYGIQCYGYQWTKVATCVTSRSADQCAKRWQQSLDPRLDRSEWREKEDIALLTAVESLGRHWKDIQEQYLPHRSKNCVKNRYSVLTRRSTTRLAPYADSIGDSSSEAGTPMPVDGDLPLDFVPTSIMQNATYGLYQQRQATHTSTNETSLPWSDMCNPSLTLSTNYLNPVDDGTWGLDPNLFPNQPLLSEHSQWMDQQPDVALQLPVQYPNNTYSHMYGYTYRAHHQPSMYSASIHTSPTPSSALNAPPGGPSRQSSRGAFGQPYRGS